MNLSTWPDHLKTNLFTGQDGFFELPYLSNDPQLMVKSIAAIAVAQHDVPGQAIYMNNRFLKGVMRYRQLDEGLWILGSQLDIKANIVSRALYDHEMAGDYYFLSVAVFEYPFPVAGNTAGFKTLTGTTCTFYRPLTKVDTYFYENTRGRLFNIIFNRSWAQKNICFKTPAEHNNMLEILNQKSCFINRPGMVADVPGLSELLCRELEKYQGPGADNNRLKQQLGQTIGGFFKTAFETNLFKDQSVLHGSDYGKVAAAEKMILQNLSVSFIGVECIAKAVYLSPTKLKMIFKTVFGLSMLQYHKEKNMLLAMQLVSRSRMQVKDIALITGFESSSKFTAAFKKRFGGVPSAFREEQHGNIFLQPANSVVLGYT